MQSFAEFSLESIDTPNLEICYRLTRTQLENAAIILAQEFHGQNLEFGISKFIRSFDNAEQQPCCVMIDGEIAGISTFKIYRWENISQQLYLEPYLGEGSKIEQIRLKKLRDFLPDTNGVVGELSYSTVKDKHRGKGLGRALFESRLEAIKSMGCSMAFTIARSIYSGKFTIEDLTGFLLYQEKIVNGYKPDGSINVLGQWVSISEVCAQLSLDLAELSYNAGSPPTIAIAKSLGFRPIAFSRNLSPLYVKYISNYD